MPTPPFLSRRRTGWAELTESSMKRQWLVLAVPLVVLAPGAHAQTGKTERGKAKAEQPVKKESASEFVRKVAASNQFEIQSSQLAAQKATNPQVKELAQMLVQDHTAAGDKLKSVVQGDDKLKMPKETKLDAKHESTMKKLQSASGAEFERLYLDTMLKGHQESVARYKGYASSGDNAQLKQFAEETLPVIEKHLEQIQRMHKASS
jgi:putative membrane protein